MIGTQLRVRAQIGVWARKSGQGPCSWCDQTIVVRLVCFLGERGQGVSLCKDCYDKLRKRAKNLDGLPTYESIKLLVNYVDETKPRSPLQSYRAVTLKIKPDHVRLLAKHMKEHEEWRRRDKSGDGRTTS